MPGGRSAFDRLFDYFRQEYARGDESRFERQRSRHPDNDYDVQKLRLPNNVAVLVVIRQNHLEWFEVQLSPGRWVHLKRG